MESFRDAQISGFPIGTPQELADLGIGLEEIESCSRKTGPAAGAHKGCPWFRECRFKPWRDGRTGKEGVPLKGPLNVGVEVILSKSDGGAHDQMEMPCYLYYARNWANRADAAKKTGEIVRVIGYEGDGKKIGSRCTRTLPPSPGFVNGKVEPYINFDFIQPFKRPKDRFPIEASREGVHEEMMDDIERSALQSVLPGAPTPGEQVFAAGDDPVEPFAGPVGAPRKVSDGKR